MDAAVHSAQILLIVLASYLLFTVTKLSRQGLREEAQSDPSQRPMKASSRALPRIESIARLQMFAGAQLLELRMNGVESKQLSKRDWLLTGVGHYFLGACRAIADQFGCVENDVSDMMHFVLRRNLGLDIEDATHLIDKLMLAPEEEYQKQSSQSGFEAARNWLSAKHVPGEVSLMNKMAEWGFTC